MKGNHVVIVGGSSGIGLALAKQAIVQGLRVTIASRSKAKLESAYQQLDCAVSIYVLDASNESQVIKFFESIESIDHLVSTIKPEHVSHKFTDAEVNSHKAAFDAKYWGQYFLTLYGVRSNPELKSVTLTSGIASSRGYIGFSGTAAINGAIESLIKSLSVELTPIRINAVSPGFIERFPDDHDRYKAALKLGSKVPLQRLGSHYEVSQAYLFLMKNKYSTGTVLTIDGGELSA